MKRREWFSDNSAVSPVISNILMVAITVILAAVIASLAFGFVDSTETAPQGSFTGEQVERHLNASQFAQADFWALEVTYQGGDPIDQDQLKLRVNGQKAYGVVLQQSNRGYSGVRACNQPCHRAVSLWDGSGTITAGDTVTVVHKDDPIIIEGRPYTISTDGEDDPDSSILRPNNDPTYIQLNSGDTVQVIWESESGETTAVLFEETIQ